MSAPLFVAALALVIVAACGGSGAVGGTIEVTGEDYAFTGIPETVAAEQS